MRFRRVLIIEDDEVVANLLVRVLHELDFGGDIARTAADGLRRALDAEHSVILLDWNLPDGDGLGLLRRLRAAGVATPIVMTTARAAVPDKVRALEAGADDYLCKPFDSRELAARLEAVLRRSRGETARILHAGRITVDLGTHEVFVDDARIGLTHLELRLLLVLFHQAGEVARRSQITAALWGPEGASSNVLEVHVARLREKLGSAGDQIETVRGVGYRLRGRQSPERPGPRAALHEGVLVGDSEPPRR